MEEYVLRLVALSRTTREIASELGIAPDHVRQVKAEAMQRAQLATRLDVIRYARERGWIERL
jgi:DNA-binding NarL/FixJ family response regulator